ncbi:baeRF3 domain-containing protein [Sphingobacterium suaedae]|uniref:Nucleoid-associated protein n=1 Tax=Sphingobacterium suaedae TaxID=1686402 RepID=A0ABW5KPN0_9SPHI
MKTLDIELLETLTTVNSTPALSIYLPVHRNLPESAQDHLTLKNLLRDIRAQMSNDQQHVIEKLIEPIEKLLNEKSFSRGKQGTLAIFSSADVFETIFLPEVYPSAFYYDDCFYVVPLLAFTSINSSFYLLALGKNHVRLFEGDCYGLEEITLEDHIPTTMKEALGDDLTDNHLHGAAGGSAGIHGYMEITDEKVTDNTRFFRIVDREIDETYCKHRKIPLLLAALPENISLFQSLSKNECLVPDAISLNADGMDKSDLHRRALHILETQRQLALQKQINRYAVGKSEHLATDAIADIAVNAMDGRIERLFVAAGKRFPGTVSLSDRKIKPDTGSSGDIINKIALLTYKNGGKIHTLAHAEGAFPEGIGALNRF